MRNPENQEKYDGKPEKAVFYAESWKKDPLILTLSKGMQL